MNLTGKAIEDALQVMIEQQTKGVTKYGVSIEDAGLDAAALVRHAQEEAADLSVYLAQLATVLGERQQSDAMRDKYERITAAAKRYIEAVEAYDRLSIYMYVERKPSCKSRIRSVVDERAISMTLLQKELEHEG